jgi:hypothetical protein
MMFIMLQGFMDSHGKVMKQMEAAKEAAKAKPSPLGKSALVEKGRKPTQEVVFPEEMDSEEESEEDSSSSDED